jgi:hypothetical protein
METLAEILTKCEALGHTMSNDPPGHGHSSRFTCTTRTCGRAVLHANGGDHWYGSALVFECTTRDPGPADL